jgi:tripartite-type tricarboxylate transporter receptor subunit TctC
MGRGAVSVARIRLVVPFPPAGIADLSSRIIGEGLRVKLGQTIMIENKPGANGIIGLDLRK